MRGDILPCYNRYARHYTCSDELRSQTEIYPDTNMCVPKEIRFIGLLHQEKSASLILVAFSARLRRYHQSNIDGAS